MSEKISLSKEDLKDVLECPICLTVPREGPIFQCENGHIVCKECFEKIVECPQCKSKMPKCRNLHLEKIIERYDYILKLYIILIPINMQRK